MSTFKLNNFAGGLNQSADDSVLQINQSRNAQNVDVSSGTLKTIDGYSKYIATACPAGITRLMKFYKNNTTTGAVTSYLLAATATAIYYYNVSTSAWVALATGLTSGDWDYFNYQIAMTDVVIMGNGADDVKKWDGTTFANLGGTPPKMKSVTLHRERVWGTGVKAFPNSVYYSDDINPENWTGGEDAAGEISVPTWDGGVCIGLSNIFDDVVVFKTNSVMRVVGTYPGNYEVKQVYSTSGAIAEKTIVSSGDKAFFLSKDGLYVYGGISARPLLDDKAQDIIINPAYAKNAVSIVYKNKLYCAFPEGTSTTNNSMFVYDLLNNTLMIWRGIAVADMMEYEDKLLFASGAIVYNIDENSATFDGADIVSFWETPWQDLDAFRVSKTADSLYLYAKGNGMLRVDVTFDNKTKTKNITLTPNGKLHPPISLNLEGRRFKLKFSNISGSKFELTAPELTYEADED